MTGKSPISHPCATNSPRWDSNRHLSVALFVVSLTLGSGAQAALELYGIGPYGGSGTGLFSIDPQTGSATAIGHTTDDAELFTGDIAYDSPAATMYAVGYDTTKKSRFSPYTPSFYSIDLATGTASLIGRLDPNENGVMANGGGGLTFDSGTNVLYSTGCVTTTGNDCISALFQIDRNTGAANLVGSTGGASHLHGAGLAYDPINRILYGTGFDDNDSASYLYSLNPASGLATRLFKIASDAGIFSFYTGLVFDVDSGNLFASSYANYIDPHAPFADAALFVIDPTNQSVTLTGDLPISPPVGGLAFAPAPVPLPGTLSLLASALAGLGFARRRWP